MALIGLAAALPTLVAMFSSPELILDDIQFAATARFEGLAGFVDEMSYRPGQGLVHGLQFTAFGTNAVLHLLLLAVVNGANAVLGHRLLRYWMPPHIAGWIIAVWILLPDRGSTRFWVSTVPNHLALSLTLAAAIIVSRKWLAMTGRTWLLVGVLLVAATVTYEAIGTFAALVVLFGAVAQRGWHRPALRDLVGPAAVTFALGAAALFVMTQSPRGEASTLLAAPVEGVGHYLRSLGARPLGPLGLVMLPLALGWALIDRRPDMHRNRVIVALGVAIAGAGLFPFLFAGFNVQNVGVLDRSMFFASLGTAMILGSVCSVIASERRRLEPLGRHIVAAGAVVVGMGGAVATFDDLGPYASSWRDQQAAAAALIDVQPERLGLVDRTGDERVVLVDVPLDDGVAWAHYGLQVQDLYQIVNDDPGEPMWLGLSWNGAAPNDVAVTVVDDEIQRQAPADE